jgi:hypothetical protein
MMEQKIINYQNKLYIFTRDIFEPEELFHKRIWYVIKNLQYGENFNTLIKKSRIINNKEFYECKYDYDDKLSSRI